MSAAGPYDCWLGYRALDGELPPAELDALREVCARVAVRGGDSGVLGTALDELITGVWRMLGMRPAVSRIQAVLAPAKPAPRRTC